MKTCFNLFFRGALFFLFTTSSQSLLAQQQTRDFYELLNTALYKNIVAYNIRYASPAFNGIPVPEHIRSNADLFYRFLMPDYGYRMKMTIQPIDSVFYPDTTFHLYKVTTNGFDFISDNGGPEIGSAGPVTNNLFLVALNSSTSEIKFISGEFFTTDITDDFKTDAKNPSSLLSYLQFRFYDVIPVNISFNRHNKKSLIYAGFSEKYKAKFIIEVPKNDIDHPHITIKK